MAVSWSTSWKRLRWIRISSETWPRTIYPSWHQGNRLASGPQWYNESSEPWVVLGNYFLECLGGAVLCSPLHEGKSVEGELQKSATTLPSCRGYLEVDYGVTHRKASYIAGASLAPLYMPKVSRYGNDSNLIYIQHHQYVRQYRKHMMHHVMTSHACLRHTSFNTPPH